MNEIFANISQVDLVKNLGKALDSELKINMLILLDDSSRSVHELCELLGVPASTVAFNVNLLEKAGLITTELKSSSSGTIKICSKKCPGISIGLISQKPLPDSVSRRYSMPVSGYCDFSISTPCGMALSTGDIFMEYEDTRFYSPEHLQAQLIWFSKTGRLCYRFPNEFKGQANAASLLELSFEACSEAPNYRNEYKSDITVWINGVEIATWTSPGDFGGRRGRQNPAWWPEAMTQYGMLKIFRVTDKGVFVDNKKQGSLTIRDLSLADCKCLTVEIGVKEDAAYKGGMNLFGIGFGDYNQDIVLTLTRNRETAE